MMRRFIKTRIKKLISPFFWGSFRSIKPVSSVFGFDRGQPIDRYYIEGFLKKYQEEIRGVILEIGDDSYTYQFGKERVVKSEVLHAVAGNPKATIIGDLSTGEGIPESMFDCMILTQTLPFIFNIDSAIKNCYQALKPGGILLVTVPGISQISRYDMDRWGDYWRFTNLSVTKILCKYFNEKNVQVETYGNVKTAVALLHGLAAEELEKEDLNYQDQDYQLLIGAKAVKET